MYMDPVSPPPSNVNINFVGNFTKRTYILAHMFFSAQMFIPEPGLSDKIEETSFQLD